MAWIPAPTRIDPTAYRGLFLDLKTKAKNSYQVFESNLGPQDAWKNELVTAAFTLCNF